ncbi:MAG TPA: Ig domain-containing protein, partial [Chloroflexota bacterium]|nr:Ig domain-containing protein [Chloroflexota bacterium]
GGGGGGGAGLGGALFVNGGATLVLSGDTFSGNTAQGGGSGGSGAVGGDGDGGAIFNAGKLCDVNTAYRSNQALGGGGGTAGAGNSPNVYTLASAVPQHPGEGLSIGPGSAPACAAATVTPAAGSATASATDQTVTLNATVAAGGAVNDGTVTFVVFNGGSQLGSVVSGAVSSGNASASYTLPGGTAAGGYTVDAIYTPGSGATHAGAVGTTTLTVSTASAPAVTTTGLPLAQVGAAYSARLQASGGTAPYTWTLSAGSLPSGVTLAASGTISGTPTVRQSSVLTVTVTDSKGQQASAVLGFVVSVTPDTETGQTIGTASGGGASFSVGGNGTTTPTLSALVTGTSGTIVLTTVSGNPVPTPSPVAGAGDSSSYFDVLASQINAFSSVSVRLCGLQSASTPTWWNGSAWLPVSTASFDGPTGCLTFTITATTSPTLSQLSGTFFSADVTPAAPAAPILPGRGWIDVAVRDAAGVPVNGAQVGIYDTPIPRQGADGRSLFEFPALSITDGYGGANCYRVQLFAAPAGYHVSGDDHTLACVQPSQGTLVTFVVAPDAYWAQVITTSGADLRSGTDAQAVVLGHVAQWAHLRVDRVNGQWALVYNPATKNWAYADLSGLGKSGPPPGTT